MKSDLKKINISKESISDRKSRTIPNIYIAENSLSGQRLVKPVSQEMQQFIKIEFSKIKL